MNKVLIKNFNENKIEGIIDAGFNFYGLDKKLASIKSVFIKPNLVTDVKEYIEQGANTDIRIIEAVIKYLSRYPNLKVFLGESETGTKIKGRRLDLALELMGVKKLQNKYNFQIVNLTYDKKISIRIPEGKFLKRIELGKTLWDADLIINLPKIKTHKYATVTCALKNMFGVIPNPLRIKYHQNIHQVIADLNRLFYDKMFVITDGIVGMEGQGPLYGEKINLGIILFADNPLLNDVAAAKIMRFNPQAIRHLILTNNWAKEDIDNTELIGNLNILNAARKFKPANKNLFVKAEGFLMQFPWIVRVLFNEWVQKNITYHFNKILKKLRGGSYSWYIDSKKK